MTSIVLAARLDGWIQILFFLVVAGVAIINKILESRRKQQEQRTPWLRPPAERAPRPEANMEPKDVDQFLDEVLRGRGAKPARPEPQAPKAPERDVVVLRPGRPPAPPRPRQPQRRPQQPAKRAQRTLEQAETSSARSLVDSPSAPRGDSMQDAKRAIDQAAMAASNAGALEPTTLQPQTGPGPAIGASLLAALRTPADLRRAVLLSEIFGPPRAHRRRRR